MKKNGQSIAFIGTLLVVVCFIFATTVAAEVKIHADDGAYGDNFGEAVAISGDYAIVGAKYDDENNTDTGSAYIFERNASNWTQQTKLTDPNGELFDYFGCSVSISGEYAIVGARRCDSTGAAFIYKREGTSWVQHAKLKAADGLTNDYFGHSVSISGDYAVVGAYGDDHSRGMEAGAAYIFKREGSIWIQQAKLIASDSDWDDSFGLSVSISGNYIIVGAYRGDEDKGSAYIYRRDGENWIEEKKLTASDISVWDGFGYSVSIADDYAVVGASQNEHDGIESGAAYVYKRNGSNWDQPFKLIPSNGERSDEFGHSVCISGNYIIVGAYGHELDAGSVYIFREYNGLWIEQERFTAIDNERSDKFGCAVSISGNYVIFGAMGDGDIERNAGAAYIYDDVLVPIDVPYLAVTPFRGEVPPSAGYKTFYVKNLGPGMMDWTAVSNDSWLTVINRTSGVDNGTITVTYESNVDIIRTGSITVTAGGAPNSPKEIEIRQLDGLGFYEEKIVPSDRGVGLNKFGFGTSIFGDYAIIGAPNDPHIGVGSGSAYIFKQEGDKWVEKKKLIPTTSEYRDDFGISVSIFEDYAIVGTTSTGWVSVFKRVAEDWIEHATLYPSDDISVHADFGCSVSISGEYAIVGAVFDDENGSDSGSAYIFKRDGDTWVQQVKLLPEDGNENDGFGSSVSISGNYAIVGAYHDLNRVLREDGFNNIVGSAYIYARSGDNWNQQSKLLPVSDPAGDSMDEFDSFGYSVSISDDYAIVGAPGDSVYDIDYGSAYVFQKTNGTWNLLRKLFANDGDHNDSFGTSVSISNHFAVIGALGNGINGAAYVLNLDDGTSWKLIAYDGGWEDRFGYKVSVSGDNAIVGCYDCDRADYNGGAAYIYKLDSADTDSDKLSDDLEDTTCTDPFNGDTDGDGLIDGKEDFNRNGLVDQGETDPCDFDTDDDRIPDGDEDLNQNGIVDLGETDPLIPDPDADGDGVYGDLDNCPNVSNPSQEDSDGDGIGDDCDICPDYYDNDIDGDGICGDVDLCPNDPDNDIDGDGICGDVDLCPNDPDNDIDGDGICGDVDLCPDSPDNNCNPPTSVSLTSDLSSPQVEGTAVTFTALATGVSGNYEYRFLVRRIIGRLILPIDEQSYSPSNTYQYIGGTGIYTISVWARNASSTARVQVWKNMSFSFTSIPAPTSVSLTSDLSSPQVEGTAVTFTAMATGGSGEYEYRFLVRKGFALIDEQSYSPSNTYQYIGGTGIYTISVWARNACSTARFQVWKIMRFTFD